MNQIEEEDSSPFCKQTLRLKVSLLPSSLRDVRSSIEKNINQMLFTYNSTCQGVMLAYDDLKILDQGKILNEFPHIHYSVSITALTFTPRKKMKLVGKISESFPSHVGLLIHDFFNGMVSADNLVRAGFRFDAEQYTWLNVNVNATDDGDNNLALEYLAFEVSKVHECAGVISLEGENPKVVHIA